ncbi:MAG: hypothetical protein JJU35_15210 [Balneolales bacterium]|nr:hypothetical protein [Balneolales bacterium]
MITVLGKTFSTEEERRTYFREELRKKLPELKQMEGFPIGEDEDILNLSDPPYYTACPNPWLNDFIAEWEEEKKALEKKGLRKKNFEVTEPYAADVSEGKNNPIYNAHSYHTKVPHPAIMRYILHYTQPGDIVFDGFAGTGMTGVASTLLEEETREYSLKFKDINGIFGKRRFVTSDLSPIASFINYCYNSEVDIRELDRECGIIYDKLESEVGWMYKTKIGKNTSFFNYAIWSDELICNNCGNTYSYWSVAIDENNKVHNENLVCDSCNHHDINRNIKKSIITKYDKLIKKVVEQKKYIPVLLKPKDKSVYLKKIDDDDLVILKQVEDANFPYWVPIVKVPKGDKTSEPIRAGITYVHHYFTKRNLLALSLLKKLVDESQYPLHLQFILTGMIQRSSLMNRIHVKNFFYGGGGWNAGIMKGTIHIPSIPIETSIIEQFRSRHKGLIEAKKIINKKNGVISVSSATSLNLSDNSIDYIFTDPPFGANIMYSELNLIWESWLKVVTNNTNEAIENRNQKKSLSRYSDLMTKSFREYFRVLKPNKYMTVEFSNTKAIVWNIIQNSIANAGFIISNVSALDKKQGGMRSISSTTGVRQDLVISCYKPSVEFNVKFKELENSSVGVWEFVNEHLEHLPIHLLKGSSTTAIIERSPKILFDRLIAFYVQRGLPVPIDASKFQQGLRELTDQFVERDGMFFTLEQAEEYDRKKAAAPNFVQLDIFVTNEQEAILWLKNILEKEPQTEQDLHPKWMKEVAGNMRKGDTLPEMRTILEENFLKNDSGQWYLPDPENEADKEEQRTKRLLKQFKALLTEIRTSKKKIKEVRVEAVRAGFTQCYKEKDFKTIVEVGERIPEKLLMEDEMLLQFFDIADGKA